MDCLCNAPAPDAGHAAETMSNEALVAEFASNLIASHIQPTAYSRQCFERISQAQRVELLRRLDSAPARTAGTETGGEK